MNKVLIAALLTVCALCACNQPKIHGNGNIKSETRDLPAFESLVCDGGYDLHVESQAAKQAVQIETDDNLLHNIKTEVRGNTLHVSTKGNLDPTKDIRITIAVPQLSKCVVQGSVDGDILNIKNDAFAIEINGSARLKLTGTTDQLNVHIAGFGKGRFGFAEGPGSESSHCRKRGCPSSGDPNN